jgi:hypothetical protein
MKKADKRIDRLTHKPRAAKPGAAAPTLGKDRADGNAGCAIP